MKPRLLSCSSSCCSSYSPRRISLKTPRMPTRTTRLSRPMTHRNTPETDAPITPVAAWSVDPSWVTGPASALTPSESSRARAKTIVECPRENQKPTESGLRPVLVGEQLARGVVDRRDVVGVEGVAQPERVGQDPDADGEHRVVAAEPEVLRRHQTEEDAEPDHVQQHDEPAHGPQGAPVGGSQVATEPDQGGDLVRGRDRLGHGPI